MSLTLKIFLIEKEENEAASEIRRFQWQQNSNLDELKRKISTVFSAKLEPELISLFGKGESEDEIKIESDSDLVRVLGQAAKSTVKLWVTMQKTKECVAKSKESIKSGDETGSRVVTTIESDGMWPSLEPREYSDSGTQELYQAEPSWPKLETETLVTSPTTCEPELTPDIGTKPHPSELDSPQLDARFCTSYGKNGNKSGFASTFHQIMKDFNCCPTLSSPTAPDLPPQFVESLCTLREMGFEVENPNVLKILRKNNGNLEKTIEDVLNSSF